MTDRAHLRILLVDPEALFARPLTLMRLGQMVRCGRIRILLLLLLPESVAQLSMLLKLSACGNVGRGLVIAGGAPCVHYFCPDLAGRGAGAELLLAHLRRIVAIVLGHESGHVGRYLGGPVSCRTAKSFQRNQARGCGP